MEKRAFLVLIFSLWPAPATALQTPIQVQLALSELLPPAASGTKPQLTKQRTRQFLQGLNRIWSTCDVAFTADSNVLSVYESADTPYKPRTQEDLSRIASRLHPQAFRKGSVPFTLAGNWSELEPTDGLKLHGLGWAFYVESSVPWKIDRMGAFVGAEHFGTERFVRLAAHEIGHALTLGHSTQMQNVMGRGDQLEPAQCLRVRRFIRLAIQPAARPLIAARSPAR